MTTRTRRMLVAASGIAALLIVAAWLFDWNLAKPYIERRISQATGRQFEIHGNLRVHLSLHPLVEADGITLANAGWSQRQPMLDVKRIVFRIDLWRLLQGDIDLPEVTAHEPQVVLERAADGRRNWVFRRDADPTGHTPHIGHLRLDHGTLTFDDAKPHTRIILDVNTDAKSPHSRATSFSARGEFKSLPFSANGRGGDVLALADTSAPFPIEASLRVGTTHGSLNGTITGLAVLDALDLKLALAGDDLSALYPLLGIALIPSPPYTVNGELRRSHGAWEFHDFKGKVGDSDIAGDLDYDMANVRPLLKGNVVSRVLDLRDLSGFVGARRAPIPEDAPAQKARKVASAAAQRDRILPDQAFRVDRLRAMDTDVTFSGKSIRNPQTPLRDLDVRVKVDDGVMTLDPLHFGMAGGTIAATVVVDARQGVPKGSAKATFRKLQLPKLFPGVALTRSSVGTLGGTLDLAGHGSSVGALLASSDGRLALAISSGEISNELLEFIGLDGGEILKFLFRGDRNVPLRCAVADFSVRHGVMTADTFVFDTTDTIIFGKGSASLVDETLALEFIPQPKDVSIFSLRSPLHLVGTFRHPTIKPDSALALRVGATIALGALVTPLAALIPLIETGPGKDADCGALLASVRRGPVTARPGK